MLVRLRALALAPMMLLLAWQLAVAPIARTDDGCPCEEEEEAETADAGAGCDEGAPDAHETCPPDCDDCSCCGGASMIAARSTSLADVVPVRAVALPSSRERDAPRGQATGVFRPPRA